MFNLICKTQRQVNNIFTSSLAYFGTKRNGLEGRKQNKLGKCGRVKIKTHWGKTKTTY